MPSSFLVRTCNNCGLVATKKGEIRQFPIEQDDVKQLLCKTCWDAMIRQRQIDNKRKPRRQRKLIKTFPYR